MNVRKTITSTVAIAGLLAVTSFPAFAANDKVTLFANPTTGGCSTGATGGVEEGFAKLTVDNGNVSGGVVVKGAQPNTTYDLFIFDQNCNSELIGTLTTNGQGNGHAHFSDANIPGATGYFVALRDQVTGDAVVSQIAQ